MAKKKTVMSVAVDVQMHQRIKDAATDDMRQIADEVRYLISLGLQVRDQVVVTRERWAVDKVSADLLDSNQPKPDAAAQ